MKLYGTTTSPFVRRVRIVAAERMVTCTLLDVNQAEHQATMRTLSPIWKVPVAVLDDDRVVYDSRVIIAELCATGWGPMRSPPTEPRARVQEENLLNLIDEATHALVRNFYLKRDGGSLDLPMAVKDQGRALAILQHIDAHAELDEQAWGRPELALATSLDWIGFRNLLDAAMLHGLRSKLARLLQRPSFVATIPVG
jgi:glutathione S-transferase